MHTAAVLPLLPSVPLSVVSADPPGVHSSEERESTLMSDSCSVS